MDFKPLFDRVVIDPKLEENVSKAGIVLPQTSQERPQTGVVVAVGDGENFDCGKTEMRVQVGDKVLFAKYSGSEFKVDGEEFIIIRQGDILAIVE